MVGEGLQQLRPLGKQLDDRQQVSGSHCFVQLVQTTGRHGDGTPDELAVDVFGVDELLP